ncbi:MAG: peptidylprolyl isomerase [Bacteroidetes bacterium]|nr:peptidylprolyl isomerase [Bacteroidota bacterium]
MALIGKIRKNSWLLIVLIGLGLGGFVIMDMFSGQQSIFGSQQSVMGEIDGKVVDINEFNRAEGILYAGGSGNNTYGNRSSLWNYFVEEAIVSSEADALGLGVSKKELLDLEFGSNDRLSPVVKARYSNPQNPNAVDREQLNQIKGILDGGKTQMKTMIETGQLNPNFPYYWKYQEGEITKDRLQSKLINMVEKSMYTPNWMAEMIGNNQNAKVDFNYVQIPFDKIDDADVALADADYQKYLDQNIAKYTRDEETRKVEYVEFKVTPSKADSTKLQQQITDLKEGFASTDDDSIFVQNNFGSISQFWMNGDALNDAIAETVFQMPVGSVYGPYLDGNSFKAVKILDRQMIPDSAKSRHILISATDAASFAAATKTIDSLKTLLLNGAEFDTLAAKFSQDPGSAQNGGFYDYVPVNQFVPEFNDIIFYSGNIGSLYSVRTQFGVHLIEPMGRKGNSNPMVRVAYISQNIEPSEETQELVQEDAIAFLDANPTMESMIKSATEQGFVIETSPSLTRNDFAVGSLGAGNTSREIVRWAFNNDPNNPGAEVGSVSPQVYGFQDPAQYFTNKYVVVGLKNTQEAGVPSVASIKDEIELEVLNMKKGETIIAQLEGKTDLNAIAGQYSAKVDTAKSIAFSGAFIPNVGNEPAVVASALNLDINTTSAPIVGNNGVYVVMPTYKPTAGTVANIPQLRQNEQNSARAQVRARLIQAMRKRADVEDNRARFF